MLLHHSQETMPRNHFAQFPIHSPRLAIAKDILVQLPAVAFLSSACQTPQNSLTIVLKVVKSMLVNGS